MIPKKGAPLTPIEIAALPTEADIALAKKRANADATPAGRAMFDATVLPADERARGPIADE